MGRALIVDRLRSAVVAALVMLVVAAVGSAASAAVSRVPSLHLVSPHRFQVFQRGDNGCGDICVVAGQSNASGREAAGQPVPVEGSPWALPAQVFVDAHVVTPGE